MHASRICTDPLDCKIGFFGGYELEVGMRRFMGEARSLFVVPFPDLKNRWNVSRLTVGDEGVFRYRHLVNQMKRMVKARNDRTLFEVSRHDESDDVRIQSGMVEESNRKACILPERRVPDEREPTIAADPYRKKVGRSYARMFRIYVEADAVGRKPSEERSFTGAWLDYLILVQVHEFT